MAGATRSRTSRFLLDDSSDEEPTATTTLPPATQLTQTQKDRMETNRKRALEIRQAKEDTAKL
jgi:hypothetical protein